MPDGGEPVDGLGGVSEAEQAETLREGVRLARESDWAGPLFWYGYRDLGGDVGNNEHWFGILDQKSRRKPAWEAFQESFKD